MHRPRNEDTLRFGYTVHGLLRIAKYAAYDCRFAGRIPFAERVDVALSAVAEHVYRAEEAPTEAELRNTAWNALSSRVRTELRHHGFDGDTGKMRVAFIRYWSPAAVVGSPENAVVERIALAQIRERLHPTLQEALGALAEWGDYGPAAAWLGVSRAVLAVRVSRGRAEFFKWWHEGEEPSRLYSRHRPRREGPDSARGSRRPATTSVAERERYLAQGKGGATWGRYNRARRVTLPVSDAELARRYHTEDTTLTRLAEEYGTSHYTIRRRIQAADHAR